MKKTFVWVLAEVAVIMLVFVLVYAFFGRGGSGVVEEERSAATAARNSFLAWAGIFEFPATRTSQVASLNGLPEELSIFVVPGATNTRLQSIVFDNGKIGFLLDFETSPSIVSLQKSFTSLLERQEGWEVLKTSRIAAYGFIDAQHVHYIARVHIANPFPDEQKVNVTIEVMER